MNVRNVKLLPWIFIGALLFLNACATGGSKWIPPQLTLVGASMTSGDMFSQQFRVRLHVQNPNARALPIKLIDYKLFLEGDSFAEGVSAAPFVVPANGEQEFDLLMHTNFMSSIGRLLSRLDDRRTIHYDLTGKVTLAVTFSPKVPFTASGEVKLGRK